MDERSAQSDRGGVAQDPERNPPDQASLWDLFELEPHNGGQGKYSDRGKVLSRLYAKALCKLRDWLEENEEQAVERYMYNRWLALRTHVGAAAWLKQLPPDTQIIASRQEDGLPLQGVAVRTDGKKWDLNIPVGAPSVSPLVRGLAPLRHISPGPIPPTPLRPGHSGARTSQDGRRELARAFSPTGGGRG